MRLNTCKLENHLGGQGASMGCRMWQDGITGLLHTGRNLIEESGRKMLNKVASGMNEIYNSSKIICAQALLMIAFHPQVQVINSEITVHRVQHPSEQMVGGRHLIFIVGMDVKQR